MYGTHKRVIAPLIPLYMAEIGERAQDPLSKTIPHTLAATGTVAVVFIGKAARDASIFNTSKAFIAAALVITMFNSIVCTGEN